MLGWRLPPLQRMSGLHHDDLHRRCRSCSVSFRTPAQSELSAPLPAASGSALARDRRETLPPPKRRTRPLTHLMRHRGPETTDGSGASTATPALASTRDVQHQTLCIPVLRSRPRLVERKSAFDAATTDVTDRHHAPLPTARSDEFERGRRLCKRYRAPAAASIERQPDCATTLRGDGLRSHGGQQRVVNAPRVGATTQKRRNSSATVVAGRWPLGFQCDGLRRRRRVCLHPSSGFHLIVVTPDDTLLIASHSDCAPAH
jgi:hypothetical protein